MAAAGGGQADVVTAWSSTDSARFRIRTWDGEEAVAYDIASGDTHLLEPLAFELFNRLAPGAFRSAQSLLTDLADVVESDDPDQALAAIEASLHALLGMGLVVARAA